MSSIQSNGQWPASVLFVIKPWPLAHRCQMVGAHFRAGPSPALFFFLLLREPILINPSSFDAFVLVPKVLNAPIKCLPLTMLASVKNIILYIKITSHEVKTVSWEQTKAWKQVKPILPFREKNGSIQFNWAQALVYFIYIYQPSVCVCMCVCMLLRKALVCVCVCVCVCACYYAKP